jgi:hypothetical protein
MAHSREEAVAGVTSGLISLGQQMTLERLALQGPASTCDAAPWCQQNRHFQL